MSARSSTVLPGFPPRIVASTPVFPTPVRGVSPSARSRSATSAAVRVSSNASSGWACRSRRVSTNSSRSAADRVRGVVATVMARDSYHKHAGRGGADPARRAHRFRLLRERAPPLDLALELLLVQHLDLDPAVLGHVERRVVGNQRLGLAVALDRQLPGVEIGEVLEQVVVHRLGPPLAQLLIGRGAAARVGVPADLELDL